MRQRESRGARAFGAVEKLKGRKVEKLNNAPVRVKSEQGTVKSLRWARGAGGEVRNFALDGGMEEGQDEARGSAMAADSIRQDATGLSLRESNRKSMKCQL